MPSALPSLHFARGRARTVSRPFGARAIHRARIRHGLCRPDAGGVRRALPRRARLLFGHGKASRPRCASRAERRGRRRSAVACRGARHPRAPCRTGGSRGRRCGDHRGRAAGRLSRYRGGAAEWVDPLLGERTEPDAQIAAAFARSFPIYLETRKAMRPIWRALQHRSRGRTMPRKIAIIGDLFMRSDMFEAAIRGRARTRSWT